MRIIKSKNLFVILFLCVNTMLFSQEGLDFYPDHVLIEELPISSQISTLEMKPIFNSSLLKESEFLTMLDNAKEMEPDDERVQGWQFSPWYWIKFTTPAGEYTITLYLGDLGSMTLPNGKTGFVMFNYDEFWQD